MFYDRGNHHDFLFPGPQLHTHTHTHTHSLVGPHSPEGQEARTPWNTHRVC